MTKRNHIEGFTASHLLGISDDQTARTLKEYKKLFGRYESRFVATERKEMKLTLASPSKKNKRQLKVNGRKLAEQWNILHDAIVEHGLPKYLHLSFAASIDRFTKDLLSQTKTHEAQAVIGIFADEMRALLIITKDTNRNDLLATIDELETMRHCFEKMLTVMRAEQAQRPGLFLLPRFLVSELHRDVYSLSNTLIDISQGRQPLISDETSARIRAKIREITTTPVPNSDGEYVGTADIDGAELADLLDETTKKPGTPAQEHASLVDNVEGNQPSLPKRKPADGGMNRPQSPEPPTPQDSQFHAMPHNPWR